MNQLYSSLSIQMNVFKQTYNIIQGIYSVFKIFKYLNECTDQKTLNLIFNLKFKDTY